MPNRKELFERRLKNARKRVATLTIPSSNRRAILAFSDSCFSEGLSTRRVIKYLATLSNIALRFPKQFREATRADIEKVVNGIERSDYSDWTKRDFRIALKKFFRWLRRTDEYPPEVKWLRSTLRNKHRKLPDELLTQQEVKAMIATAPNVRDKALVALLYESGCRIGELLDLHLKQIRQHKHGFQITVEGTKRPRRLLVIASASHLTAWLNQHPQRNNPQTPLWVTMNHPGTQLSYATVGLLLKRIAKRAGVRKAVNPHNFRHSRATHLAQHLTEAQMKEYFGWVQGSEMASTYVHLSGRDIDNALLRLHDIATPPEEGATENFALKDCPRCSLCNPPDNKFCSRCGMVLDEQAAQEMLRRELERSRADEVMNQLIQDKEFRVMVERKLEELNSVKE